MRIKKEVNQLVYKYKTRDPFELAECLDVIVLSSTLDDSIRGYYHFFQRNRIIHINSNLDEHNRKVVMAHELGHAVLHKNFNCVFLETHTYYIKNRYEIEADKFAAELLINDDTIYEYPIEYTNQQIACAEYVPEYLIDLKLENLSIF